MPRVSNSEPKVSADQHIRKGLKFIGKANRAIIEAAIPLEVLVGDDPPDIHQLLTRYSFTVGKNTYHGMLTKEQATYLNGQTGSLEAFAKAVVKILIGSNNNVAQALSDLDAALEAPGAKANGARPQSVIPQPVGCCSVDGVDYSCSETYCEQGLQGTWKSAPCIKRP